MDAPAKTKGAMCLPRDWGADGGRQQSKNLKTKENVMREMSITLQDSKWIADGISYSFAKREDLVWRVVSTLNPTDKDSSKQWVRHILFEDMKEGDVRVICIEPNPVEQSLFIKHVNGGKEVAQS